MEEVAVVDFAVVVLADAEDFPVIVFGCVDFAGEAGAGDFEEVAEPGGAAFAVCLE